MTDVAGLGDFKIPVQKVAPLAEFRTRRGEPLSYRLYPSWSDNLLLLIHGLAGDSRYLAVLAHAVAAEGLASVVTPDLRGHGVAPHSGRASLTSEAQLEEDMEELLVHVRMKTPASRLVWGGHSLGAGLALRLTLAGSAPWQSGLLMIAPYLPCDDETDDLGGWLTEEKEFMRVNMPERFRTGSEVLEYDRSFLEAAIPPKNFADRLKGRGIKTEVVLGAEDRVCRSSRVEKALAGVSGVRVREIPGASHMGIVGTDGAVAVLRDAIAGLFA